MKTLFLSFFLLLAFSNVRADDYLLKGDVGKYPVVFDLFMSGNQIEATYFYTSTCIDIVLKGERTDNGVVLYASHYNGNIEDTTETWQLTENANKSWTGKWIGKKGKAYDVVLAPIDLNTIRHPYAQLPIVKEFKEGDAYNYVRSSMLQIVKDTATAQYGKYSLRGYHLKNARIQMFEIVGGMDKTLAAKINSRLLNKFVEHAWNYYGCTGNDTPAYNYTIYPPYITDNILSVNITADYYCNQAAHPDFTQEPVTIDMKTGNELVLEDMLSLTATVVPVDHEGKWSDYRAEIYGPRLLALMQKLHPHQMSLINECGYGTVDPWRYPTWYVTEKGLYISPSFPHVMSNCLLPDWSYISFEELKKHKNPKKHITLP